LGKDILPHIGSKSIRDITAEYAEQRREMLLAWLDYIDGLVPSGHLVIGAGSA